MLSDLSKTTRTLNDHVEEIYLLLIPNQDFRNLIEAVWDEQAIEGSISADSIMAAQMIRERARKMNNTVVSKEKLATIAKAMGVVLRRYGFSRAERRNMVHGEIVPGGDE